jgi:hypothetical protein
MPEDGIPGRSEPPAAGGTSGEPPGGPFWANAGEASNSPAKKTNRGELQLERMDKVLDFPGLAATRPDRHESRRAVLPNRMKEAMQFWIFI